MESKVQPGDKSSVFPDSASEGDGNDYQPQNSNVQKQDTHVEKARQSIIDTSSDDSFDKQGGFVDEEQLAINPQDQTIMTFNEMQNDLGNNKKGHKGTVMNKQNPNETIMENGQENNSSQDMSMNANLFNQVREASDTQFEKKDSDTSDDNIIGGLGSISEKKDIQDVDETVMMGQNIEAHKSEEQKFGAFDNETIDEDIGEDEVDLAKEGNDKFSDTDEDDDDIHMRFSKHLQSTQQNHLNNQDPQTMEENRVFIMDDDNQSQKSGMSSNLRSISIAKPSLRMDILTADDFHKGMLEKQSPKFLKQWQKRYFVLEAKTLKYYKSQTDFDKKKPPKGVINFQQLWIEPIYQDLKFKIDLKIQGSNRTFNLRCVSAENYESWKKKIAHSINSSNGKKKELNMDIYKKDMSKFFDFWRFHRVDEAGFENLAEVGDLILCQSKKKFKLGTGPSVDKICMVVKLQSEQKPDETELYILRVGTSLAAGIVLQPWEDFRVFKSQKLQDCWYRHLHCNRNDLFLKKTQNFIQKIRDKQYVSNEGNQNGEELKKRLYKNAELIAKYYRYVGLLVSDKKSNMFKKNPLYDPKDFSQESKNQLHLQNQSSLGDDQIIMFNESDITEKMKKQKDQVDQQQEIQIQRTKEKLGKEMALSVIDEADIEQTIKMKRNPGTEGEDDDNSMSGFSQI